MPLYTVPVTIYATAYIRSYDTAKAVELAKTLENRQIEVQGDELISGIAFDNPQLPELSLSPAMQIANIEAQYLDEI